MPKRNATQPRPLAVPTACFTPLQSSTYLRTTPSPDTFTADPLRRSLETAQPELCGGLRLPPMGTTGKRVIAASYEEASARIQGLERGGSRFSELGVLENQSKGTSRCEVLAAGLTEAGLSGHRRRGRPLVLPVCHPGTAESRSLTFTGSSSPRRCLSRWVWIHTPRVCSRSESHFLLRGQSLPSCRKSTSWARRWCQRSSSLTCLEFSRHPGTWARPSR
jgi:hypothetical protein